MLTVLQRGSNLPLQTFVYNMQKMCLTVIKLVDIFENVANNMPFKFIFLEKGLLTVLQTTTFSVTL